MKHTFIKMVMIAVAVVASAFADETFNGVGVAITPAEKGAEVVSVIPGTPAADSKLQKGDVIISVNGNNTYCKKMEDVQTMLRGEKNKPVEIVFISNGDTLGTTIRRTELTVTNSGGVVVSSVLVSHAMVGYNRVSWNSSNVPDGRYVISVEHNGFKNGKSVFLK
jgi:C-terminal processing protease CtpA/Prc